MSHNLTHLKNELERFIDEYSAEVRFFLEYMDEDENVTKDDLEQLHRHTFYTFMDFKNSLIEYLQATERRQP